jgi:hypothetical protein
MGMYFYIVGVSVRVKMHVLYPNRLFGSFCNFQRAGMLGGITGGVPFMGKRVAGGFSGYAAF